MQTDTIQDDSLLFYGIKILVYNIYCNVLATNLDIIASDDEFLTIDTKTHRRLREDVRVTNALETWKCGIGVRTYWVSKLYFVEGGQKFGGKKGCSCGLDNGGIGLASVFLGAHGYIEIDYGSTCGLFNHNLFVGFTKVSKLWRPLTF